MRLQDVREIEGLHLGLLPLREAAEFVKGVGLLLGLVLGEAAEFVKGEGLLSWEFPLHEAAEYVSCVREGLLLGLLPLRAAEEFAKGEGLLSGRGCFPSARARLQQNT